MTKVIPFSRFRIIFPVISAVIILAGVLVTFATGGLNLGIDFRAGVNIRAQVAPVAARIAFTGAGSASLDIDNDELTIATTAPASGTVRTTFRLGDYATFDELRAAIVGVPGVSIEAVSGVDAEPSSYLPMEREVSLGSIPSSINVAPSDSDRIAIGEVRSALSTIGTPQIQTVGSAESNDFMIRIEELEGATDFDAAITERITELLEDAFGRGTVLVRGTDYVGARFSANLAQQTVYLSVIALALILAYSWFRFKLAYAVSAIVALLHDSIFIFAFIGTTGLEFSTATIAAVLTIIGYSLNDTIVIFDRIRENTGILRGEDFRKIVDTSITQSLSRTLMTSVTTLIAVIAIFVFGTGTIRDFALAMIVGVIVGTYSSLFIASPLLIGWVSASTRRRKSREAERYGIHEDEPGAASPEALPEAGAEVEAVPTKAEPIPHIDRKPKGKRKKKR